MKKKYPNGTPQLKKLTKEEIEKYRIKAYEPII